MPYHKLIVTDINFYIKLPIFNISQLLEKLNSWAIRYSHCKHNYSMDTNLFSYFVYQTRCIWYYIALELVKGFWSKVLYNKANRILKNLDLKIERKQFYNFIHAEETQKLKLDKKFTLLLATLNHKDFRVSVNNIYLTNTAGMINSLKNFKVFWLIYR